MADFKDFVVSAILIGIFIFAFIGFGAQLAIDNNLNNSILNNDAVNRSYVDIQSELEDARDVSESQQESFFGSVPVLKEFGLILESLAGFTTVFFNLVINLITLPFTLIGETIGISPIVLGGISAIIMISLLLLVWSVWRQGR